MQDFKTLNHLGSIFGYVITVKEGLSECCIQDCQQQLLYHIALTDLWQSHRGNNVQEQKLENFWIFLSE